MTKNKHYRGTPAELDAVSKIVLIENEMDDAIDAAYGYARTITAEGSRDALVRALDAVVSGVTDSLPFPGDMPGYEVDKYSNAAPVRRLINLTRGLTRWKAKAGQLVDA